MLDPFCGANIVTLEERRREAPPARRAAVAHELLNSRESPADSELRQLWVDELHCSARRS
jgi:hypothetical protein